MLSIVVFPPSAGNSWRLTPGDRNPESRAARSCKTWAISWNSRIYESRVLRQSVADALEVIDRMARSPPGPRIGMVMPCRPTSNLSASRTNCLASLDLMIEVIPVDGQKSAFAADHNRIDAEVIALDIGANPFRVVRGQNDRMGARMWKVDGMIDQISQAVAVPDFG